MPELLREIVVAGLLLVWVVPSATQHDVVAARTAMMVRKSGPASMGHAYPVVRVVALVLMVRILQSHAVGDEDVGIQFVI
mmetsp:Transcript_36490/g.47911  ORF Transcript_36490/g.47911 Transcript_36490/m.47911 type:complete len:80 (-) Transcript_36490:15-254(-)